jgi:hypothetical protein
MAVLLRKTQSAWGIFGYEVLVVRNVAAEIRGDPWSSGF